MERKIYRVMHSVILIAAFAFLLGGCASDGALTTQKMTAGEKAVSDAKAGNAASGAPRELEMAEGKLAQAKEAFAKKEYEKAGALAEQASVDAQYARTKATAEKNKKALEEMKKENDTLRQEIERLSKQ
jgi:PBP1b-binding outer membrane lipoprotein LpoB